MLFNRNTAAFLCRFITTDETWVQYYTLESKKLSTEWTEKSQPAPKKVKMTLSFDKLTATVFWDTCGIIFIDYLEKDKTTNEEYYVALLQRLSEKEKHLLFW